MKDNMEIFKKVPLEYTQVEIRGKKHYISWPKNTAPAMHAILISLANMEDCKIDDVFRKLGVYLLDWEDKIIWPGLESE